ncbi:MAG: hypothetical protein ACC628_18590 [Pirellulaceae bacterium]
MCSRRDFSTPLSHPFDVARRGWCAGILAFLSVSSVLSSSCVLPSAQAATLRARDIVVADEQAVFLVDPMTGDRTLISGNSTGSGPNFVSLQDVAVDEKGNIFVTNLNNLETIGGSLMRVDAATGDRTLVTGGGVGSGPFPEFSSPRGIDLDQDGNILVTVKERAVVRVLPETGERVAVSGLDFSEGEPFFDTALGIAISAQGDIFVMDDEGDGETLEDMLFRVDPSTGKRTIVSDNSIGGEPRFDRLGVGIDLDDAGNVLVVSSNQVLAVDPTTGIRTLVSGGPVGSGPSFDSAFGLDYDPFSGRILIADASGSVLSVDPATGDRVVLSGSGVGDGPNFVAPHAVAVVPFLIAEPSSTILALCGLCGAVLLIYRLQVNE